MELRFWDLIIISLNLHNIYRAVYFTAEEMKLSYIISRRCTDSLPLWKIYIK